MYSNMFIKEEDRLYGDRRGDELPPEFDTQEKIQRKIAEIEKSTGKKLKSAAKKIIKQHAPGDDKQWDKITEKVKKAKEEMLLRMDRLAPEKEDEDYSRGEMRKYTLSERIYAFIEITRPWWLIVLLPVFIAPAILAARGMPPLEPFIIGIISFIFMKSGASTINDYFDRDVDRIIHKNRPIPTGRISANDAFAYSMLLFVISLFLAIAVNRIFFALILTCIIVCIFHFWKTKRDIYIIGFSNIGTSLAVSIIPVAGFTIVSNIDFIAILLFLIIFFYDLAHDASSSIRDIKGDSKGGITTFAATTGVSTTSKLVLVFFTITFIISLFLGQVTELTHIYLISVISIGVLCYITISFLVNNPSSKNAIKTHTIISIYPIIISCGIILNILYIN